MAAAVNARSIVTIAAPFSIHWSILPTENLEAPKNKMKKISKKKKKTGNYVLNKILFYLEFQEEY